MLFQYVQLRYVLFWDKMISVLAILIFILARAEVMLIIGEAIVLFIFSVVEILLAKKIMKR